MLLRNLLILLIPLMLMACHPKEAVVTETLKEAATVEKTAINEAATGKEAKLEALVIDEATIEETDVEKAAINAVALKAAAVEKALKENTPLFCPRSSKLKNGQCLCNASAGYGNYQPIGLRGVQKLDFNDAQFWVCGRTEDYPGDAWFCATIGGCKHGDAVCGFGGVLKNGNCTCLGADKAPGVKMLGDYRCQNGYWVCDKKKGCGEAETACAYDKNCFTTVASSDGDALKQDKDDAGFADKHDEDFADNPLKCGTVDAPKRPGYLCENKAWICRDDIACLCGNSLCNRGAECQDGKCLCGTKDNQWLGNSSTYICENAQWTCKDREPCICGSSFAPSGSTCRDGKVFCGDKLVENGKGYRCENDDEQAILKCGDDFHTEDCACGDHFCPSGTICKDGDCFCDDDVTPYLQSKEGYTYACESKAYICVQDACKCGENGCGRGGKCKNDRCVCDARKHVAPKDAASYACCNSVLYYAEEEGDYDGSNEVAWRCNKEKGCLCGDTLCGYNGVCDADRLCRCGKTPAPSISPEKYICHFDNTWGLPSDESKNANANENANEDEDEIKTDDVDRFRVQTFLQKPDAPGYSFDKRAWICTADLCACGSSPCLKGHYCVGNDYGHYCTP